MEARNPHPPADRTTLWLVLLLLVSVGVFSPTLLNGFTLDDPIYARAQNPEGGANRMVAELHAPWSYWAVPMNVGETRPCRGYRPLTVLSYAVVNHCCATGDGEDAAFAQHLLNLLLHGLATWATFLLVRRLTAPGPALIAALVFGVHALHSGPVAAIVGRGELLGFVCGAAMLLVYDRSLRAGDRQTWRLAAVAVLAFLCCSAKENALPWFLFAPLYARIRGIPWRQQAWPAAAALGLPLFAYLLGRALVLDHHLDPQGGFLVAYDANPLYHQPAATRVLTATPILVHGLVKTLWPSRLSAMYGDGVFPTITEVFDPRFLFASLLLVTLVVGAFYVRRGHPLLFLAAAAFFGFTFITSNLAFPIESVFGDRLFYTAVLGPTLLAAAAQRALLGWRSPRAGRLRWAAGIVFLLWVGWNIGMSVSRSLAWRDNLTLVRADLASQPDAIGLHVDLGNLLAWNFDRQGSLRAFREAVRRGPHSPRALRALAAALEPAAARTLLERALRSPHLIARGEGRRVHLDLGMLLEKQGQTAAALRHLVRAVACDPVHLPTRIQAMFAAHRAADYGRLARLLEEGRSRFPPGSEPPVLGMYEAVLWQHQGHDAAAARRFAEVLPRLGRERYVLDGWSCHAAGLRALGRSEAAAAIERQLASRRGPPRRAQPPR